MVSRGHTKSRMNDNLQPPMLFVSHSSTQTVVVDVVGKPQRVVGGPLKGPAELGMGLRLI